MKKQSLLILLVLVLLAAVGVACAASNNDVVLSPNTVNIFEGDTVALNLYTQGDAVGGNVTWKSNTMKVATVDQTGVVRGVSKGSATITATVKTAKRTWNVTCRVNVLRAVTSIVMKTDQWNLYEATDERLAGLASLIPEENELPVLVMVPNNRVNINATTMPRDASSNKISVRTSDKTVVDTSNTQAVAKAPGVAYLTVASQQNPEVYNEYLVLVLTPVKSITIRGDQTIFLGGSTVLEAHCTPSTADMQEVLWTSSAPKVAVVDEYGIVRGLSRGTTTITATAADGSKVKATFRLTVSVAPTSLSIRQNGKEIEYFNLNVSAKTTLTANVLPATVSDKTVRWSSSDPSIATVNDRGQVAGIRVGTAIITAESSVMGDVRHEVIVNVVQPVTALKARQANLEVYSGESVATDWLISPVNATIQELTYKSSDVRIATVDANGVVHGISGGKVSITATTTDGSRKSAKVNVTVIQPVTGVHMKSDSYTVGVSESVTLNAEVEPASATNKNMTWYIDDPSVATIRGTNNRPKVTGLRWGETTAYGTTEDGGYSTWCTIHVGDYNKALKVTDCYILDNEPKLSVQNESNMTIKWFTFEIKLYDIYDNPLYCNTEGTNVIHGSYSQALTEGRVTTHGRFNFGDYLHPNGILARIEVTITGYTTDTGYKHTIPYNRRITVEYKSSSWVGPQPEETEPPILVPETSAEN